MLLIPYSSQYGFMKLLTKSFKQKTALTFNIKHKFLTHTPYSQHINAGKNVEIVYYYTKFQY